MLVEIAPDRPGCLIELEKARTIRNAVREFMTNNTDIITPRDQVNWYNSLDHEKVRLFLYYADTNITTVPIAVGYGIINQSYSPFPLLTGAISPEHQGKGYGRKLFKSLLDSCDGWLAPELDVRADNEKAIKLYESLGFERYHNTGGIISMIYRPQS